MLFHLDEKSEISEIPDPTITKRLKDAEPVIVASPIGVPRLDMDDMARLLDQWYK